MANNGTPTLRTAMKDLETLVRVIEHLEYDESEKLKSAVEGKLDSLPYIRANDSWVTCQYVLKAIAELRDLMGQLSCNTTVLSRMIDDEIKRLNKQQDGADSLAVAELRSWSWMVPTHWACANDKTVDFRTVRARTTFATSYPLYQFQLAIVRLESRTEMRTPLN